MTENGHVSTVAVQQAASEVLLLTDADIKATVIGQDAVARSVSAVEKSFAVMGRGEATAPAPGYAPYPPTATNFAETEKSLNVPMGVVPAMDAMTFGTVPIARDHVTRPHSLWQFLMSYDTFQLKCIMEDHTLHTYMVGAQFGVAAKWLAREDAATLAVIGSGRMARACVRAIATVRRIEHVKVYSPTAANRDAFAEEIAEQLGIRATACESARDAVEGADIVQCATNAETRGVERVLEAEWLSPGCHVSTMSRNELGEDVAQLARVIPAGKSQVLAVRPAWQPWNRMIEGDALPDLGPDMSDIVAGSGTGRTADDQVTAYLGCNLGTHRVAMAAWVYEEAVAKGVGTMWDLAGLAGRIQQRA